MCFARIGSFMHKFINNNNLECLQSHMYLRIICIHYKVYNTHKVMFALTILLLNIMRIKLLEL